MTGKRIIPFIAIIFVIGVIWYLESGKVRSGPNTNSAIEIPILITEVENQSNETENKVTEENMEQTSKATLSRLSEKSKKYSRAKEITTPDGYINTAKINLTDLVGKKVILIDFWTYSCINCQRTTPYLNAWYEKYKRQGLEIIGIHTPEFEFEKKYENVVGAVKQFGIQFPVVLDNDYSTWHAYNNRYWPRKYLIDIDGFVIYDHIGEGGYAETENLIQMALKERLAVLDETGVVDSSIAAPENAESVDFTKPRSPEIYFGSSRNVYLGNGKPAASSQNFILPGGIKTNILYLEGDWKFTGEYAESVSPNAKIVFRYQGQKVFMVASADRETQATATVDGEPLQISGVRGSDIVSSKFVDFLRVKEERLYRVVEAPDWGEHTLELTIENPGFRAFTFTFG